MMRLCALLGLLIAAQSGAEEKPVTYAVQIKPIFDQHCVSCHAGWFPDGQLRLDSLENIREGGKRGPVILPGKPDKGWLINLVTPRSGGFSAMPPGPARLSDKELALLRDWIAQGAR